MTYTDKQLQFITANCRKKAAIRKPTHISTILKKLFREYNNGELKNGTEKREV